LLLGPFAALQFASGSIKNTIIVIIDIKIIKNTISVAIKKGLDPCP
jgi:hypothetical protein